MRLLILTLCWLPLLAQAGLPLPDKAPTQGPQSSLLDKLAPAAREEQAFLEPDQAFRLAVTVQDAQTLRASFEIAPGHYLYRDRIGFKLKNSPANGISAIELPQGELKHDPNFGDTQVFHHSFAAVVRLQHGNATPATVTLLANYQGCSEKGLCYAPIHKTFVLALPADSAATQATTPKTASANESDQIKALLSGGRLWLIAAGFFGFGLLLSLTPCVFPMIPILSGIIVGRGAHPSRLHAFNLSLAYTLGMAVSYTLAGIAAGLSGHLLSNALQNPWALGAGAVIFVLLALSMFGFYELRLPIALESRMADVSNRFKGGHFAGVFLMGALSALIVSPCVAAPLAGALLYIGQTHNVVLGGVALFALSMGMGVPLLLLGASAGTVLPKAGAWMKSVQNFFGVMMLGMAIWLISPVIPAALELALWGTLLIVPAIYLHALDSLPAHVGKWGKFWKGIAIIALVTGIALLIGALAGSKNPLQPLAGLRMAAAEKQPAALPFRRVRNVAEFDAALKNAAGKHVMLDFYADWCVACKEYEQSTFSDPQVQKLLANVVLLQADVTQNSLDDASLLARFHLFGPPGIVFFDRHGREIPSLGVVGYQDAPRFLVTLNGVFSAQEGNCVPALEC